MDFAYSDRVRELQECTRHFMQHQVLPVNDDYLRIAESGRYPLALIDDLKAKAKTEGLWNLFLPGLRPDEPGTRLSNVEYAPLAATNIRTSIRRVGDEYVINGRKWFITGALHPNCKLCIVMGVTDEAPDPHN